VRLLLGGIGLLSFMTLACAQPPARADDPALAPMRFEWKLEGPAAACGNTCRTWISATGAIVVDTPKAFEKFVAGRDVHGAMLAIDSGGGSVIAALSLGRMLRDNDITTTVGRSIDLAPGPADDKRARLSPSADCESMCAFVLLGGKRRFVPPEAQVLVHQIWLGDRRDDATAANYSAEDLMLVQRDIGRLARYTVEMGGDIELLETSLRIPPWERLRALSQDELRRMHLQNVDKLVDEAPTDATATASPVALTTPAPANITERSWGIVDNSGARQLARRHPLTVEGDEIGNFDLMITCGDKPDSYALTYVERRKRPGVTPALEPLKEVAVWSGKQLAVLKIVSSGLVSRPAELETVARGEVPAALMQVLAESRSRSLTVATRTVSDAETAIRVGNTGVSASFPQLIAACGKDAAVDGVPGKVAAAPVKTSP